MLFAYTNRKSLTLLQVSAAVLLASCGGYDREPARAQLPLACQTVECECVDQKTGLFTPARDADIVWDARGRPSCPEGFRLERVQRDVLGNRKK